jgi:zinc transport system substrate-binding protein
MKNKIRIIFFGFGIFLGFSLLSGCNGESSDVSQPEIAVTNSYLQCVVDDVCDSEIGILSLASPGMCPGHFDISPSQVNQLRKCKILLLFDFQKSVEESLSRLKENGLKTYLVKTSPGLCIPDTYLAACNEVARILSSEHPDRANRFRQQVKKIEERMRKLSMELKAEIEESSSESIKVLASEHQAHFADWLGLETIATFVGSDIETITNINSCLKTAQGQNVEFVIANKQEGTSLANALAERLQAKAVIFSNFPEANISEGGFDSLLRSNVKAILEAAGK